ncbi:MAG: 4-hydroxy-tetrahydrodipicolinate synthase [Spirochaetaceae bacterium]|jgi:4-hydroxy-tetrahydrodipicolinate synthase|nr:4-hydroxy-tetrahydrodipicolinate synthase [Spirochaetaceae bacterium]
MLKLQGAFTAMITPMTDSGAVDYAGWEKLIKLQIESGIDGLVPIGTTGETPTLEEDEEEKLLQIIVKTAGGKVPVIAGAGSNSTKHAVMYTKRAKDLGADAALVVTPYYNKPNDDGLLRHFEAVSAVGIPVIVYNIASRTGRNIPTPLMRKIAEFPNIAGVKESSGDINQIGDVIQQIALPSNGKFTVLSGDDGLTLPLMALGGSGVISVISNLVPAKIARLVKLCHNGNFKEAAQLHFELLPLIKAAFVETNPVPIKAAMAMKGLPAGGVRSPLGKLSSANVDIVHEVIQKLH